MHYIVGACDWDVAVNQLDVLIEMFDKNGDGSYEMIKSLPTFFLNLNETMNNMTFILLRGVYSNLKEDIQEQINYIKNHLGKPFDRATAQLKEAMNNDKKLKSKFKYDIGGFREWIKLVNSNEHLYPELRNFTLAWNGSIKNVNSTLDAFPDLLPYDKLLNELNYMKFYFLGRISNPEDFKKYNALKKFLDSNDRLHPVSNKWFEMYNKITGASVKDDGSGQIVASWKKRPQISPIRFTGPLLIREKVFEEHLKYSIKIGMFKEIDSFLRNLKENEWVDKSGENKTDIIKEEMESLFKEYVKYFGDKPPYPPPHIMETLVKQKKDGTFDKFHNDPKVKEIISKNLEKLAEKLRGSEKDDILGPDSPIFDIGSKEWVDKKLKKKKNEK